MCVVYIVSVRVTEWYISAAIVDVAVHRRLILLFTLIQSQGYFSVSVGGVVVSARVVHL